MGSGYETRSEGQGDSIGSGQGTRGSEVPRNSSSGGNYYTGYMVTLIVRVGRFLFDGQIYYSRL